MSSNERILKNQNLNLIKNCTFAGTFQMPRLLPYDGMPPSGLFPFHKTVHRRQNSPIIGNPKANASKDFVHFFLDDYQFERLWNAPERYLTTLSAYAGILSPDFSLYQNMPIAVQIWNTYRNRTLACWIQQHGLNVIPTVSWSDSSSYHFCFDGLPTGGTFALSSIGTQRNALSKRLFCNGFKEFIARCQPDTLIVYGEPLKLIDEHREIKVCYYPNDNLQRLHNYGR